MGVGREAPGRQHRGGRARRWPKPADRRAAVEATVRQYREVMRALAEQTELGVWYFRLEGEALVALVRAQSRPPRRRPICRPPWPRRAQKTA